MKYLNTIEAKGGVLFDAVKDFEFEQARPGFLYFDDNIGNDSAEDGSHVVPALKLKVYNNPNYGDSTKFVQPQKANFHYILTSYLSKDINSTGNALAGGVLKPTATTNGHESYLSKSAATALQKNTTTLRELRRVNLEQGRITNAQIVPIYDSELVTKKWVESKLGSFRLLTPLLSSSTYASNYLDSSVHALGPALEASEATFSVEGDSELATFITNAEISSFGLFALDADPNDTYRMIPVDRDLAVEPVIVSVTGVSSVNGATKGINGIFRVSNVDASTGELTLSAMNTTIFFKEPTYALSVYSESTNEAKLPIKFNLEVNGEVKNGVSESLENVKTKARALMTSNNYTTGGAKIAGKNDNNTYARLACTADTGDFAILTYKATVTVAANAVTVTWTEVTAAADLPEVSYKQVFPDISFIKTTATNGDIVYRLQLGFANTLVPGSKFFIAYAG